MDDVLLKEPVGRRALDFRALVMALFVALSFLVKLYTLIFRSYFLLSLTLSLLGLFLILLIPRQDWHQPKLVGLWGLAFLVVIARHLDRRPFLSDYLALFVFFACLSLLLASGERASSFRPSEYVILSFAIFYSLSVWIQVFLPSLYQVFLDLLPEVNRQAITEAGRAGRFFTGFSSNAGFTGGHIVTGLLLVMARAVQPVKTKTRFGQAGLGLFLFLSLLMTGRRAQIGFLFVALALMYVWPHRGKSLVKKLGRLLIALLVVTLLFLVLVEWSAIPFFIRVKESIQIMASGGDVSTGRHKLYGHAWRLFLDHPWFGIGWGNYRLTTIGAVTVRTELAVHNIYLQLLAETGLIGFIALVLPMIAFLYLTGRSIREERRDLMDRGGWDPLLLFSLGYQVFFLLYGLTGNPLYEPFFLMIYFYASAITTAYQRSRVKAGQERHAPAEASSSVS